MLHGEAFLPHGSLLPHDGVQLIIGGLQLDWGQGFPQQAFTAIINIIERKYGVMVNDLYFSLN